MPGYYDKNKDYSKELQRTDLSVSERAQLTQERQNKIDDKYGGKEPNMIGSDKTYSQTYDSSGNRRDSGSSGSSSGGSSSGSYGGIDYTRNNNGGGIYGAPTSNSDMKNYTRGGVTYSAGADMSRRPDLAGGYAISNGYTVFYDNNGYAYKASKGVADYTPHQDINAGNGSYNTSGAWTDNEMLSAADKQKIADIRSQLQAGKITGDQANQAANAIRAGYGYSIDKNGYVTDNGALARVNDRRNQMGLSTNPEDASTGYYRYLWNTDTSPLAQAAGLVKSYEDFANGYTPGQTHTYPTVSDMDILQGLVSNGYNTSDAGKPSFDYSYDSEMRALIDQILNSNLADWKQGDQYAALRDQYAANGQMSMSDLMGQVSSRTGGLASSYAASVANQEYNNWMSKLEQAAQEMYQQDRSDKLNNLGVLNDAYSREYGAYADQLNQWNTDRAFDYKKQQDALANEWQQKQWDYNMSQDEWNRAAQQAETMAAYGDFSGYKALGYTDAQIDKMRQAYQIQQTAKASSGGTVRTSGSGNDTPIVEDYDGLMLAAEASGHPESYIANHYKEYGFNSNTGLNFGGWQSEQDGSAYNNSYFNAAMSSIRTALDQGKLDTLESGISSLWGKLNARQKAQLQELLAEYGKAYEGD